MRFLRHRRRIVRLGKLRHSHSIRPARCRRLRAARMASGSGGTRFTRRTQCHRVPSGTLGNRSRTRLKSREPTTRRCSAMAASAACFRSWFAIGRSSARRNGLAFILLSRPRVGRRRSGGRRRIRRRTRSATEPDHGRGSQQSQKEDSRPSNESPYTPGAWGCPAVPYLRHPARMRSPAIPVTHALVAARVTGKVRRGASPSPVHETARGRQPFTRGEMPRPYAAPRPCARVRRPASAGRRRRRGCPPRRCSTTRSRPPKR